MNYNSSYTDIMLYKDLPRAPEKALYSTLNSSPADTPDVDGDRCFWACRKKYSQRDISYGNKLISGSRGFHWQTEAVQPTKKSCTKLRITETPAHFGTIEMVAVHSEYDVL